MGVEVDKLLTLKAFYLARRILKAPHTVANACEMVDAAFESLNKKNRDDEKRLLR